MANKHIKIWSISLIIEKYKSKLQMRYHPTVDRIAIVKIYKQDILEKVWRKGNILALLVGM